MLQRCLINRVLGKERGKEARTQHMVAQGNTRRQLWRKAENRKGYRGTSAVIQYLCSGKKGKKKVSVNTKIVFVTYVQREGTYRKNVRQILTKRISST